MVYKKILVKITEKLELKKFKKLLKEDFSVKNANDYSFQDIYFEYKIESSKISFQLHDEDSKTSSFIYFDRNNNKNTLFFPIKRETFIEILNYKNINVDFHLNKSINRDEIEIILEDLDFVKKNQIFVKRSEYENKNLIIKVDDVENLGIFIEFNIKIDSISENFLLSNFGFEYEKLEVKNYTEIFNNL